MARLKEHLSLNKRMQKERVFNPTFKAFFNYKKSITKNEKKYKTYFMD